MLDLRWIRGLWDRLGSRAIHALRAAKGIQGFLEWDKAGHLHGTFIIGVERREWKKSMAPRFCRLMRPSNLSCAGILFRSKDGKIISSYG